MNKHLVLHYQASRLTNMALKGLIGLFIAALLSGCFSTSSTEKTSNFVYAITASPNINPDIKNRPSSVVVRVYQLKNKLNFENARYEDIFNPIKNVLGAEFIAVNEYLIDPGMSKELEIDVAASTQFIGIAVGYRSVDTVNWRSVVALPERSNINPLNLFSTGGVRIIVDELNVRAQAL